MTSRNQRLLVRSPSKNTVCAPLGWINLGKPLPFCSKLSSLHRSLDQWICIREGQPGQSHVNTQSEQKRPAFINPQDQDQDQDPDQDLEIGPFLPLNPSTQSIQSIHQATIHPSIHPSSNHQPSTIGSIPPMGGGGGGGAMRPSFSAQERCDATTTTSTSGGWRLPHPTLPHLTSPHLTLPCLAGIFEKQ